MKSSLIVALCAATVSHAIALDRRQAPATPPKTSSKGTPKGLAGGKSSPDLGSFVGSALSIVGSITKTLNQAKSDLQGGKPFGQVFDEVLPKIMEEAKLHTRMDMGKENLLRTDSKNMRATFGPYRLAGKNVSIRFIAPLISTALHDVLLSGYVWSTNRWLTCLIFRKNARLLRCSRSTLAAKVKLHSCGEATYATIKIARS
jgi:hypothetical protein